MNATKRIYKETLQIREYAVNENGIGMEWVPGVEKVYEFCSVDEFLRTFKPKVFSENLKKAIEKAYNECGKVTFNLGSGNKTFTFNE